MDSIRLALEGSRRGLAVGVWSLLLLTLMLPGADLLLAFSIGLIVVISIVSALALLLIDEKTSEHSPRPLFLPSVAAAIALSIPLLWSIRLSEQNSAMVRTLLGLVSITGPSLAAMIRTPRLIQMIGPVRPSVPVKGEAQPPHFDLKVAQEMTLETAIDEEVAEKESDETDCTDPSASHRLLTISAESFSPDVTQWLTRSRTPEEDRISGGVRVEFAAGERDAIVHLSFCPAFMGVPDVETEDLDGEGLEIRVAAVFPFGARLAVRQTLTRPDRGTPSSASSHCVGFTAIAKSARRAA